MTDNRKRIALITAGSRGLGEEIVRQLAADGCDIAFTYLKDDAAAKKVSREIESTGCRCLVFRADVADFSLAQSIVGQINDELGGIDVLVCNAGAARSNAVWKMSENDWDGAIDISLKGAFNYIRAVAPLYMTQMHGKVICIGSINGLRGRVGTLSYNVAKAGLLGLVKTVAAELGRFNVNVNLVSPGYIETPSQATTPELIRDLVLKECAIKRLGTPADIAPIVVFLASEAARHVTGQIIKVDAGQYL
jgi:3-oxoacyl-[acyl-carrier protein] reductase